MERNLVIAICLAVFVFMAGCGGLFGQQGGEEVLGGAGTPTSTTAESPSGTTDRPMGTTRPAFGPETNTDAIVLRLSDLSDAYDLGGETDIRTSEASGTQRETFESRGVVRQHSRSFSSTAKNEPQLVLSEVTLFESDSAAASRLEEVTGAFEENGARVESVELATGIDARQIAYENDREAKTTLVYVQRDNMLLLVITAGNDRFYEDRAHRLMVEMVVDV